MCLPSRCYVLSSVSGVPRSSAPRTIWVSPSMYSGNTLWGKWIFGSNGSNLSSTFRILGGIFTWTIERPSYSMKSKQWSSLGRPRVVFTDLQVHWRRSARNEPLLPAIPGKRIIKRTVFMWSAFVCVCYNNGRNNHHITKFMCSLVRNEAWWEHGQSVIGKWATCTHRYLHTGQTISVFKKPTKSLVCFLHLPILYCNSYNNHPDNFYDISIHLDKRSMQY